MREYVGRVKVFENRGVSLTDIKRSTAFDPQFLSKSASSVIAHFSMPPARIRQVNAVAFDLIPFFMGITGCGL